jgi:hypothetical protein
MDVEHNSVHLVDPKGDSAKRDKSHQEKWLIYCPEIADDTLLYMISQLESYSIRSYGGHLGVNTTGLHAAGVHTTSEFMERFKPDRYRETSYLELSVDKADRWSEIIERKWAAYQKEKGLA